MLPHPIPNQVVLDMELLNFDLKISSPKFHFIILTKLFFNLDSICHSPPFNAYLTGLHVCFKVWLQTSHDKDLVSSPASAFSNYVLQNTIN